MILNEVKKALYRENPPAELKRIRKNYIDYEAKLQDGSTIYFSVHMNDIGDATFYTIMESKLLIRWIRLFD